MQQRCPVVRSSIRPGPGEPSGEAIARSQGKTSDGVLDSRQQIVRARSLTILGAAAENEQMRSDEDKK